MPLRLKTLLCLSLLLLSYFLKGNRYLFAQKIIFAEKIDSLGNLVNQKNSYFIDPISGSSLTLAYEGKQAIMPPKAYFFLDKKLDTGIFQEFDNQRVNIGDSTQTKVSCQYLFIKEGVYRISFANAEKKILTTALVSIKFSNTIVFTEKINAQEQPENHTNQFVFKPNLEIYSYLKLSKPMDCNNITHQIYKHNGKDYSLQIFTGRFLVNRTWDYTYLKFIYHEKGKYKVLIKSETGAILGVNYLKIE
jgi:hypothetical protein